MEKSNLLHLTHLSVSLGTLQQLWNSSDAMFYLKSSVLRTQSGFGTLMTLIKRVNMKH